MGWLVGHWVPLWLLDVCLLLVEFEGLSQTSDLPVVDSLQDWLWLKIGYLKNPMGKGKTSNNCGPRVSRG